MEPTLHRRRFGGVGSIFLGKSGSIEWHRAPSLRGGRCRRHRSATSRSPRTLSPSQWSGRRYKCRRGYLWAGAAGASLPEWACIYVAIAALQWQPSKASTYPRGRPWGGRPRVASPGGSTTLAGGLGWPPRRSLMPSSRCVKSETVPTNPCEGMHRVSVVVRFLQGLIAPWELHRLRRRLPTTPRLWVRTESGIRPETDADYLVRLRERAREKKASRSAAVNPRDTAATRRSRV